MSESSRSDAITVAAPDTSSTAIESARHSWARWGTDALIAGPDRIVSSFLVAAVPVGLAVVLHVFAAAVVLPVALLAVIVGWRRLPSQFLTLESRPAWWQRVRRAGPAAPVAVSRDRAVIGAAVALAVTALWLLLNWRYTSANVVLERDPGIYTLRAMWLVNHRTPLIDVSATSAQVTGIPGVQVDSLAFPAVKGTLYPQSFSLVPGLLAVAGWFLNLRGILVGNLLIGGVALLAVYGFARRLLGPIWALVPMAGLGAGMPLVAFARGTYSEPTALVATFGGLTMLWIAWQTGQLRHFLMAGLLVGVSSLARIDGGVTLIGILAGFGVVTLAARDTALRRRVARSSTAWAIGAGLLDACSLFDGKTNSPVYLTSEWHGILPLLIGTVLAYLLVIGMALLPVTALRRMLAAAAGPWTRWVVVLALVLAVVMLSRPWWWTSRQNIAAFAAGLEGMQRAFQLPVDGLRSYDESSVNWLAMYYGWPVVLLGAVGAALLLGRTFRRRDPRLAAFTMLVASVSVLYLNKVSIFPDQVWAMRRFLPVIIPGLLIAAVYPLARLVRRRPTLTWIAAVLAVASVGGPMIFWGPNWAVGNAAKQPAEMSAACQIVGNHPVILVGPNPGAAYFLPTFKIGCHSSVVSFVKPTASGLSALNQRFTARDDAGNVVAPVVVSWDPTTVPWQGAAPAPVIKATLQIWEQPLQRAPRTINTYSRSMYVGNITATGQVVGVSAPTVVIGP